MYQMNGKRIFVRASLTLVGMSIFIFTALIIAGTAMEYSADTAALNAWIYATRFGWLIWRLILYIALGWGIWKIHKAPGFRDEYRQPLRRISIISLMFVLLCEYALFNQRN
ncbi:hypothetical protein PT300_04650 [Enterobacteriaceae bacterium ESL0689]|nr:hypothetical protein [Enterobacteriaceae bacterium ESL0689]